MIKEVFEGTAVHMKVYTLPSKNDKKGGKIVEAAVKEAKGEGKEGESVKSRRNLIEIQRQRHQKSPWPQTGRLSLGEKTVLC